MAEAARGQGMSEDVEICSAVRHRYGQGIRCELPADHAGPHWTMGSAFGPQSQVAWNGDDRG